MNVSKYRISLVMWDYKTGQPASSALLKCYDVETFAVHKALSDAKVECDRLNKAWHKENPGHVENPFVLDENSDCTAIIRFWDEDDYQRVEMYNVFEVVDKGDNWSYRKYRISTKDFSFEITKDNVFIASVSSLVRALDLIDKLELKNTVATV